MPFIPFIVAFIGLTGIAATVATIALTVGLTVGLGFLARLLAPKLPKAPTPSRDVTVNQPDAAWQIVYGERVVGGSLFAIETAGANNEFLYVGIVWCYGGPDGIEAIEEIRFGDEIAVTGTTPIGKYTGLITVEHKLGTDVQAASTILTTDLPTRFSATDKGSGHAYTVLKLKFDQDKFSDFSIEGIRARIKGRKMLDPRTGTVAWTQNPVLCIRDYLSHTRFGLGYGQGLRTLPVILDDAFNNAQANICDELVAKKAGGTRARYGMNMAFTTEAEPGRVVQEMFVAMGGGPTYSGGKWRLLAGAWRPPGVTLTDGDLRGPVQMIMALGRLQTFNGVRGVFMDPTQWQPTNYPVYAPADVLAEDDGIRIWKDLDFTAVTDAGQAQQLAKMGLEMIRQPKRLVLPCKFLAYELLPGDTFRFTHDDWVEKTFAVERIELPVEHDEQGEVIMGVDIHAREEDPGVYYWNPTADEGTYTAPPNPTLPAPSISVFVPPNSNPTARPGVLGVMTYRPLTNPLTATDAGANTTVTIAAFTQRIQGFADKSINSGSVAALAFDTLYFIYYDDLGFVGGAVTYAATTVKETAMNGAGRFFVGSIITPVDGGANTDGRNDGGVGAQTGGSISGRGKKETLGGTGTTITNAGGSVDGDDNTRVMVEKSGMGANEEISITVSAFGAPGVYTNGLGKMRCAGSITQGGAGSNTCTLKVQLDDGTGGALITIASVSTTGPSTTASLADAVRSALTNRVFNLSIASIIIVAKVGTAVGGAPAPSASVEVWWAGVDALL